MGTTGENFKNPSVGWPPWIQACLLVVSWPSPNSLSTNAQTNTKPSDSLASAHT